MIDLGAVSAAGWALLVVASLLLGFSKTAIGGIAMVSVAIFAAVLPARPSTGVVLLLFLIGDVIAVRAYTRFADWSILRRLAPYVAVGIAVGAVFLKLAGDAAVRRTIGAVLLVLVCVALVVKWQRRRVPADVDPEPPSTALTVATAAGSGFTSMVANAGGSFLALYLLHVRLPVMVFLGTTAWFFFAVNLVKLPITLALGLVTVHTLQLVLILSPALIIGALVGRAVARRMSLAVFEWVVLAVTFAAALNLVR